MFGHGSGVARRGTDRPVTEPEMRYEKENRVGVWGFVLLVYAASRLLYLGAGALFASVVPVGRFQRITADVPFGTMNLWSHWDGEHYVALAADGYLQPPHNASPAFFPLYPLLIRGLAALFGGPVSPPALSVWGPLVSLLALPFGLYFVYRIAESGWGERAARVAVLALALFPTSFFLNAAYTESLFLALSAGSIWALRVRRNLLLACLLAGLATATRNVGVFLLVPLAYEYLKYAGEYRWRGAYLALAPSGLAFYAAYLWWRFGDPLLFYTQQRRWGREATGPLDTLLGALTRGGEGLARLFSPGLWSDPSLGRVADALGTANNAYNLIFLGLALALLVAGLKVLPPDLSAYSLLLILPPTLFGTPQGPLMGLPRYVLVAFPLFIVLGALLHDRKLLGGWLALSAAFSLVLCALFVTWRFVA
jgi:Mannosyltransferase (PIG-V)